MPELPEVEIVIRYLKTICLNKTIKKLDVRLVKLVHNVDVNKMIKEIKNHHFIDIVRRGKYLFFVLDNKKVLVSHLRMEGKYIFEDDFKITKHDHLIFYFEDNSVLKYNDTRQFGTFHFFENLNDVYSSPMISKMGVEPFTKTFNVDYLYTLTKKTSKPIKTFLLDQTKIAGIGNIYANEILFATKIDPLTPTSKLSKAKIQLIIDATNEILQSSIQHNGTTIHSFKFNKWSTGDYQKFLKVHQQKNCPICNNPLQRYFVSKRGTFSCSHCQKKAH